MMAQSTKNSSMISSMSQKAVDDPIQKYREDRDAQTVIYINPIEIDSKSTGFKELMEAIEVTKCDWALKIETTVQSQLGKGKQEERHTFQASWNRASYRAKLVDRLTRTTPWLVYVSDDTLGPMDQRLNDDYYDDKIIYQDTIHSCLHGSLQGIPEDRLKIIENYLGEVLILGQDRKLEKQQFTVLYPFLENNGPSTVAVVRCIYLLFERSEIERTDLNDGSIKLQTTGTAYQAKLNKKKFDVAKFDPNHIEQGKPIVKDWTLDVAL